MSPGEIVETSASNGDVLDAGDSMQCVVSEQEEGSRLSGYAGHLEGKLAKAGDGQCNATKMCCGIEETSSTINLHGKKANADLKRQLTGAQADTFKLKQQYEQQLLATQQQQKQYEESVTALQADRSKLQGDNMQLLDDNIVLLNTIQGLEDQLSAQESRLAEYEQVVAEQQEALEAAARLPPFAPTAVQPKPWTVPAKNIKIQQLTQQLADLQEEYDELQQQSLVHNGQLQEAYDEVAEKEFEVSALSRTVANLQQEKLRLEVESQCMLDTNQQLQDRVADLQSQLQHLQDKAATLQQQHQQMAENDSVLAMQEQLKPLLMARGSSDHADTPGTPELIAGSFTAVHSRLMQPSSDDHSSSRRCSADGLAKASKPAGGSNRYALKLGGRTLVTAAAAAAVMVLSSRRVST